MENQDKAHLQVVFGGTGDLMARKLLPALYHLKQTALRETPVHVLAVARSESDDKSYRKWADEALREAGLADGGAWCHDCLHYVTIGDQSDEDFHRLAQKIEEIEKKHSLPGNRIFYLALPPSALGDTISHLGDTKVNRSSGWTRLVIEKPFGRDLESARELNRTLLSNFDEEQVYRIDHYLGKETVQNLLVFRFANPIFESVWSRDRIQSVHITVAEQIGIEDRAGYYDRSGALRDMVQNHLTQLLSLTAMEPPVTFEADSIRDEKLKVIRSVLPITSSNVVWGRYGEGEIEGRKVLAYLGEEGVPPDSTTETFVSMALEIANWRWQGVPFYLRTGKRLKERRTQIRVKFKCAPVSLFRPFTECRISSNELIITIQPDEGFDLKFEVKNPGQDVSMGSQQLRFRYSGAFSPLPDAYETLLLDIVTGDQTLFVRGDEAEEAWRTYQPLLDLSTKEIKTYPAGSWGPPAPGLIS